MFKGNAKVLLILILFLGFSGCSRQDIESGVKSDKPVMNSSETPKNAPTDEAQSPETSETASLEPQFELITDLDNWSHPVRDLFDDFEVHGVIGNLVKVELYKDKTYPVFYVDLKVDYNSLLNWGRDLEPVLEKLAAANGGWDYEIRNMDGTIHIVVTCDKKTNKVTHIKLNEWDSVSDFLVNVRDKDLVNYLATHTSKEIQTGIVASGDLDADGTVEYLFKYENAPNYRNFDYYLLHETAPGKYKNIGLLVDDYSVGHIITAESIIQLDINDKTKSVVFNVAHDATGAYGYFIYDYDGKNIVGPMVNFPGATAHGARELIDSDNDGVYEHTDYYDMDDLQQHLLIIKTPVNSANEELTLKYENSEGCFVYPKTPQELVQSYIESQCLFWEKPKEIRDELLSMVTRPELANYDLEFHANNSAYNGLELSFEMVEETEDEVIIHVSDLYDEEYKATFTLVKQDSKWKIDDLNQN